MAVDRVPESSTSRRVHRWLPPRMESGTDHVENNMVTTQPSNEIRKNYFTSSDPHHDISKQPP